MTRGKAGTSYAEFIQRIRSLPIGTLWRHNTAGDLYGVGDAINAKALLALVRANRGKRGFTYTHKPPHVRSNASAIRKANAGGFTVNLSANTLAQADAYADLSLGPVVVVLPTEQRTNTRTPAGRRVVICPAVTHANVTCATCALCQRADRPSIVGFPAHGNAKAKASVVALS